MRYCNRKDLAPPCEEGTTSTGSQSTTSSGSSTTTSETSETAGSASTTPSESTTEGRTTSGSTSEDTDGTDSSTTSSGTTSSTGSTSSDRKSEGAECTEEGFFRNPDDCTKFYRCVDFAGTGESYTRYDFECPDDLVFDEVNNVCNWPNMSPGCESRSKDEKNESKSTTAGKEDSISTTEGTTSPDESQSTGTTAGESTGTTSGDSTTAGESTGTTSGDRTTAGKSTGTTSGDSTTSTSDTRATSSTTSGTESDEFQCEDEGFFRHPKDCKKYYECKRDEDTGELIKINCECPRGHVFDEEGWYCNAEELSPPCDDGSFKCEQEGYFRDPEDCTKYHHCNQTGSGFRKESFQCPDGNVFDEEGRYCNAPELAEPCNSTSSTSSSSGTTSLDQSTTPGSGTSSNPTSTTGSGTSSNPTSTTGSETSSTSDSSTSSGQEECTEEGFFRNPEDCTKYYQCTRNEDSGELERKDFTCPDGRVFDEGVNYCNDPELSDKPCESSSASSSTQGQTDSTTSSGTSTTEKTTGATESSTTTTTEASTTSKTDSSSSTTTSGGGSGTRRGGGDPECTQAGFFRHPKDCNKFYRCVDFAGTGESYVRYDFDCPEGLHFDEVNSTCNWPTMTPRCESESE
ncbi:hypothetical protein AVEN_132805-1 [Araneus ventricosus]|uniref:Chitin-binding type-2 domain-containing protein n=1 Tax=Araneus ventricosus TaxID=182803 RepID=A0A4Y2LS42_ARAVE|nr:hypothetical protein AVEN_132805-1 [Araneus ventricosus]